MRVGPPKAGGSRPDRGTEDAEEGALATGHSRRCRNDSERSTVEVYLRFMCGPLPPRAHADRCTSACKSNAMIALPRLATDQLSEAG